MGLSFFLSKTDDKLTTEVDEVKALVKSQLKDYLDYTKDIIATDKDNGGINLKTLFSDLFKNALKESYFDSDSKINTYIHGLRQSKEEITQIIENLHGGVDKIIEARDNIAQDAINEFSSIGIEGVISSVEQALHRNMTYLIGLMKEGSSRFEKELNSTIKSGLVIEVGKRIKQVNEYIFSTF